jgi:hypothetical protein
MHIIIVCSSGMEKRRNGGMALCCVALLKAMDAMNDDY